jgi:hypothetical protein
MSRANMKKQYEVNVKASVSYSLQICNSERFNGLIPPQVRKQQQGNCANQDVNDNQDPDFIKTYTSI